MGSAILETRKRRARARPAAVGRGELGNRCGHDPRRPRFDLMWEPKRNLPPFIYEAVEIIREEIYWQSWKFAGEWGDSKRSERLEAIALVLQVLVLRTDLVSNRVGTPPSSDDEWFRGITADYIARWTGVRLGRVTRALDDLRRAGYVTSVQPCELNEETGEYTGLAAVRNVTLKLWTRLRLKNKFDTARNDACRLKMRTRVETRERNRKVRRARQRIAAKTAKLATSATPASEPATNQTLYALMAALREQHPGWSLLELRDAARRLV